MFSFKRRANLSISWLHQIRTNINRLRRRFLPTFLRHRDTVYTYRVTKLNIAVYIIKQIYIFIIQSNGYNLSSLKIEYSDVSNDPGDQNKTEPYINRIWIKYYVKCSLIRQVYDRINRNLMYL